MVAYFGSASLAAVVFSAGLANPVWTAQLVQDLKALGGTEQAVVFVAVLTVAYVYGQLASALSASLITVPVEWLYRWGRPAMSADFRYDLGPLVAQLPLDLSVVPEAKRNNRWTLIYFALRTAPAIGSDMMRRQARERLARINAMNMLLIVALSIYVLLFQAIGLAPVRPTSAIRIPPHSYVLLCLLASTIFAFEYYKRRCWNNDLLIKVMPTVIPNASPP